MIKEVIECDICRKEIEVVPNIKIGEKDYMVLPFVSRIEVTSHVCKKCLIENMKGD